MRILKRYLHLSTKKARNLFSKPAYQPKSIHSGIKYSSQWESPDLVEAIITKQIDAKDDPNWQKSGAKSRAEYAQWSWNGCGMACLKMILSTTKYKSIPLVKLGKMSLPYGVYTLPLDSSPGMFYKPFIKFIKEEFGLAAKAGSGLTLPDIKQTISNGGYVIASVTPEIRFSNTEPTKKGGHLVLIYGYDDKKKTITFNNPSGFKGFQSGVELPEETFLKFFSNKGILVFGRD